MAVLWRRLTCLYNQIVHDGISSLASKYERWSVHIRMSDNNLSEIQNAISEDISNGKNNVSVKSKLQHPPPHRATPPGIWLVWKLLFKFSPTRGKMPFIYPTLGSIQVIKCPHPGDRTLVQSGGNRCYKVTECSAFFRVSCNIQSVL